MVSLTLQAGNSSSPLLSGGRWQRHLAVPPFHLAPFMYCVFFLKFLSFRKNFFDHLCSQTFASKIKSPGSCEPFLLRFYPLHGINNRAFMWEVPLPLSTFECISSDLHLCYLLTLSVQGCSFSFSNIFILIQPKVPSCSINLHFHIYHLSLCLHPLGLYWWLSHQVPPNGTNSSNSTSFKKASKTKIKTSCTFLLVYSTNTLNSCVLFSQVTSWYHLRCTLIIKICSRCMQSL